MPGALPKMVPFPRMDSVAYYILWKPVRSVESAHSPGYARTVCQPRLWLYLFLYDWGLECEIIRIQEPVEPLQTVISIWDPLI